MSIEKSWRELLQRGHLLLLVCLGFRVGELPGVTRLGRTLLFDFDATMPAGKLQLHILAAIAEFERDRIRERVLAGLQRARSQGKKLGRPRKTCAIVEIPGGSVREAARIWGVSRSTAARRISAGSVQDLKQSVPGE